MSALATTPKSSTSMTAPPRRRRALHRLRRVASRGLAIVLVMAVAGVALQDIAERRHATAHPAPGSHVELADGRRLHVLVAGAQHDGPTVVLLGGAGASVAAWAWLLPAIAEDATVLAYDRAGLGWSDPHPEGAAAGADIGAVLSDLQEMLVARGLPGPYVLAGHSLGAHHARAFAAAHPDQVAGLVLIDPSHEDQADVLEMPSASMGPLLAGVAVLARLGGTRLYLPADFTDDLQPLPQPQRDQAMGQMRTPGYWRTFGAEMVGLDAIGATLPTGPAVLGELPLHVLIATDGGTTDAQRQQVEAAAELRSTMEQLSTRGATTVLPDASHVSIITDQRHAQVVADAIIDMVHQP